MEFSSEPSFRLQFLLCSDEGQDGGGGERAEEAEREGGARARGRKGARGTPQEGEGERRP